MRQVILVGADNMKLKTVQATMIILVILTLIIRIWYYGRYVAHTPMKFTLPDEKRQTESKLQQSQQEINIHTQDHDLPYNVHTTAELASPHEEGQTGNKLQQFEQVRSDYNAYDLQNKNTIQQSEIAEDHTKRPPNIVLFLADDMGYGDLSITGHPTSR